MKTAVIGSGSWGTALAQVLADNKQDVILYGIEEDQVKDINENHKNSVFFPEVKLNPDLKATSDINCVKDADVILLAVPSSVIGSVAKQINDLVDHPVIVVNVAKGFHPQTNERMSVASCDGS